MAKFKSDKQRKAVMSKLNNPIPKRTKTSKSNFKLDVGDEVVVHDTYWDEPELSYEMKGKVVGKKMIYDDNTRKTSPYYNIKPFKEELEKLGGIDWDEWNEKLETPMDIYTPESNIKQKIIKHKNGNEFILDVDEFDWKFTDPSNNGYSRRRSDGRLETLFISEVHGGAKNKYHVYSYYYDGRGSQKNPLDQEVIGKAKAEKVARDYINSTK